MPRRGTLPPPVDENDSLVGEAERIFGDDVRALLEIDTETGEILEPGPDLSSLSEIDQKVADRDGDSPTVLAEEAAAQFGLPSIEDMVRVKGGGLYLPVRRRVVWMRGEPTQHPDWTIDTVAEKVVEGTFKGGKVEGGYSRYRANIFDETGRLIATGTKTEFSDRFTDHSEKAETGAIGRALAVAGYGTEAAVDLDEGLDQDRIADAPVNRSFAGSVPGIAQRYNPGLAEVGRPINITSSNVEGAMVGGRNTNVTEPQLREIARLSRSLKLGPQGVAVLIENIVGRKMPAFSDESANTTLLDFLRTLSFDEASTLIGKLNQAVAAKQKMDPLIPTSDALDLKLGRGKYADKE